jgi:uncharacterized protein (DUF2252 family)
MSQDLLCRIRSFNAKKNQSVLPLKYAAMAENPFRFFRATSHLFYEDLLTGYPFPPSPLTWTCGDLHIENFGCYKDENRQLHFDINDFDEALLAPMLYDIARLAVSIQLAAIEIRFPPKETENLVHQMLHHYRHTLVDNEIRETEEDDTRELIKILMEKVMSRKEKDLIAERTDNQVRNAKLLFNQRLLPIDKIERTRLIRAFQQWFDSTHYSDFTVTDAGFRIAGTGSIGVNRYCMLLESDKDSRRKKLVDVKQALSSSVLLYTSPEQPSWPNEAERIIHIQKKMQSAAPDLLSSFQHDNDWHVVKEIQPTTDKICIEHARNHPKLVENYIEDLGVLTASAQLRSSDKHGSAKTHQLADFAGDSKWAKAIIEWAAYYAGVVQKDYILYCEGYKAGFFTLPKE